MSILSLNLGKRNNNSGKINEKFVVRLTFDTRKDLLQGYKAGLVYKVSTSDLPFIHFHDRKCLRTHLKKTDPLKARFSAFGLYPSYVFMT